MSIFKRFISKHAAILIFHLIFILIFCANFHPGKWFIGWDALNPELNFPVNLGRAITAFWQENYGLGTQFGHGVAATLLHTIFIWILSLIFPIWSLRQIFTFICLYSGGIGMYRLIRTLLDQCHTDHQDRLSQFLPWVALLGSLFYLLNFGTVQMFYAQLEAFIVHFAALPWLFLATQQVIDKPRQYRKWVALVIINILASIQGFIPPLFVAYAFSLVIYLISKILFTSSLKKKSLIVSLIVLCVVAITNAYWAVPVGYYTVTKSKVYLDSYNNLASTPEFISKNKKYGDIVNVPLIRGFTYEANDPGPQQKWVFEPWVDHFANPLPLSLGYISFAIVLIGCVYVIIKHRKYHIFPFFFVFLFFFTGITTDFPPFSIFTRLLQDYMPIYRQAFRAAFTKFSLGVSFSYSLFFAFGLLAIFRLISTLSRRLISTYLFIGSACIGIIIFALPVFRGNLFYYRLFVDIPSNYTSVINYFKTQPNGRIVDLPIDCPDGWYSYNWGYFGSGFYWYALKQPIMARSFDVWSDKNENYYWEMTQALRSENHEAALRVLKKYDIRWVISDPNQYFCRKSKAGIVNDRFIDFLKKSSEFNLTNSFEASGVGKILIFERSHQTSENFVSIITKPKNVLPSYKWNDYDTALQKNTPYISDTTAPADVYIPFRSLFTKRKSSEKEFDVSLTQKLVSFKAPLPNKQSGLILTVPKLTDSYPYVTGYLRVNRLDSENYSLSLQYTLPGIFIDGNQINANADSIDVGLVKAQSTFDSIHISGHWLPLRDGEYQISVPFHDRIEITIENPITKEVKLNWSDSGQLKALLDSYRAIYQNISGSQIEVRNDIPLWYSNDYMTVESLNQMVPRGCYESLSTSEKSYNYDLIDGSYVMRLIAKNDRQCITYNLQDTPTSIGYLVALKGGIESGSNAAFYVADRRNIHVLDTFKYPNVSGLIQTDLHIIPPQNPHNIGYDIYYDSFSQNRDLTSNLFGGIKVIPIPYIFLTGIELTQLSSIKDSVRQNTLLDGFKVLHSDDTSYEISMDSRFQTNDNTLIIYQGFDNGWVLFKTYGGLSEYFPYIFGKRIDKHVLINNWANGWDLSDTQCDHGCRFRAIYIPQLLTFPSLGIFGFVIVCGIILLTRKHLSKN